MEFFIHGTKLATRVDPSLFGTVKWENFIMNKCKDVI